MKNNLIGTAIPRCFFCGEQKNLIIMNSSINTYAAKKVNDAHNKVIDMEPCDECKKLMKQGVMLVSVKDGSDQTNPYRTGNLAVMKDEAIQRIVEPPMAEILLKKRFGFVEDSMWNLMGLPTAQEYKEHEEQPTDE